MIVRMWFFTGVTRPVLKWLCLPLPAVCCLFALGSEKSEEIDYGELIPAIREEAISGNVEAQMHYGWCLLNGKGVAVDEGEARKWLQRSAEEGNGRACYLYGMMLATGSGGKKDLVAAQRFLESAMKSGDQDVRKLARKPYAAVRDEIKEDLARKSDLKTFGITIGIMVPLLLLGYYILKKRRERLLAFSPGDYQDCFGGEDVEKPFITQDNTFPELPKWAGLPFRTGLSAEIVGEYRQLLGEKVFASKLSPFTRDMIYYLTGLDNTLKSKAAFPLLDLGALPSALNEKCLQRMAIMMANHIRMSCSSFDVVFDLVSEGEAGHIEWGDDRALIVVGREFADRPYVALKVLSHELSHQYMRKIGVAHLGEEENELLTDITSLYLGFGKYVFEGRGMENLGYYARGGVGYLQQRELGYVYDFIAQMHGVKREDVLTGLTRAGVSAVCESRWNRFSVPPNQNVDKEDLLKRAGVALDRVKHALEQNEFSDKFNGLLVAIVHLTKELANEVGSAPDAAVSALALLWEDDLCIVEGCVRALENGAGANGI